MIKSMTLVKSEDLNDFSRKLGETVGEMQDRETRLEIQYQKSFGEYSALVIGREKA